jgi:hypothetical protein
MASGAHSGIGLDRRTQVSGTEKVRENRLRRALDRQGYRLLKSRARDPRDLTFGGYQIVDPAHGGLVEGWGNANRGYALDLDGIEDWAKQDR